MPIIHEIQTQFEPAGPLRSRSQRIRPGNVLARYVSVEGHELARRKIQPRRVRLKDEVPDEWSDIEGFEQSRSHAFEVGFSASASLARASRTSTRAGC